MTLAAPSIRRIRNERDPRKIAAWLDQQRAAFAAECASHHSLVRTFAPLNGHRSGLLKDVALAHKDVFDLPSHQPGAGSSPRESSAQRPMAGAIARLHAAGALNLGCLTLSELCCGATGHNRHYGRAVNPLNQRKVVGGSSSGSAVAVAVGVCAASLGTDTAGSIRIPAATCGVLGLKPTAGKVDSSGVFRLAPSLDTVGVVARSASDAAHVWAALSVSEGQPPQAAASTQLECALETRSPWKIAYSVDCLRTSEETASVLADARRKLESAWLLKECEVPERPRLNALAQIVMHAEAASEHLHLLRAGVGGLSPAARSILVPGLAIPAIWYARAKQAATQSRESVLRRLFAEADVLLTPAIGIPVPDWTAVTPGSNEYDPTQLTALHEHFPWVNLLGLPALVFPIGEDRNGMPVSIQAVGRPDSEFSLLTFAHQAMRLMGTSTIDHRFKEYQ